MSPKFKRILLKLSGETLGGDSGKGFNYETIKDKIFSVAGGGETVAAINKFEKIDSFTFV